MKAIRKRVAIQGERGAFSEEAAIELLGEEIELVPRQTFAALYNSFEDVFRLVQILKEEMLSKEGTPS